MRIITRTVLSELEKLAVELRDKIKEYKKEYEARPSLKGMASLGEYLFAKLDDYIKNEIMRIFKISEDDIITIRSESETRLQVFVSIPDLLLFITEDYFSEVRIYIYRLSTYVKSGG